MENNIHLNVQGVRQVIEKRYTSPTAINSAEDAVELIVNEFFDLDREAMFSINIDENGKPINFSINHIGSLDRSVAHPREIFKTSILSGAKKIVLMHNHPSGSNTPSQADLDTTEALVEGAEVLGLELVDHYVFTPQKEYYSMYHETIRSIEKEIQLELNFVSEEAYSLDDVRIRQNTAIGGNGYVIENPDIIRKAIKQEYGQVEVGELLSMNLNKQLRADTMVRVGSVDRKTPKEISKEILKNAILNNSIYIVPAIRFSEDEEDYQRQSEILKEVAYNGDKLGIKMMDVFVFEGDSSYSFRERMMYDTKLSSEFEHLFVQEGGNMEKKRFTVKITETLTRDVEIEATSEEEAIYEAEKLYKDGEIELDYNDFDGYPEIEVVGDFDKQIGLHLPSSINFGYTTHPSLEFDLQAVLDVENQQVIYYADGKVFDKQDFEYFRISNSTIEDIMSDPHNEMKSVDELLDSIISEMSVEFENLAVLENKKGEGLVYQNENWVWFSHGVYDLSDRSVEGYYFDEMEKNPGHTFITEEFENHFVSAYMEVNQEKYEFLADQYIEATREKYPDMFISKNNDNKTYNLYSEYNSDDENELWLNAPAFVSYHKEKMVQVFEWEKYTDSLEILEAIPVLDYSNTKSKTVDHEYELQEGGKNQYQTRPKQLKLNRSQEKIINFVKESLKEGVVPWHQPWISSKPFNAVSGTEYKGHNQVVLSLVSRAKGHKDPRWATFNQAKEAGWKIKRGSKATQLYYPLLYNKKLDKFITAEDFKGLDERGVKKLKEESTLRLKYFNVFNGEDILGIPKLKQSEMKVPHFSNEVADAISGNMKEGLGIEVSHDGDRAFYSPTQDSITMPDRNTFKSEMGYYDTLMHELAHATGHKDRLDRDLSGAFGSVNYAEEELVAEFTSMFLSQDLGFEKEKKELENHAAYIASWNQVLEDDPSLFVRAINSSNNAYRYLYDAGKIKDYEEDLTVEVDEEYQALLNAVQGKYIAIEGRREDKKEFVDFLSEKLKINVLEDISTHVDLVKDDEQFATHFDFERSIFDGRVASLKNELAKTDTLISNFDIRRSYLYAEDGVIEESSSNVFRKYLVDNIDDELIPDLTVIIESENDMSEKYNKFEGYHKTSKGSILRIHKDDLNFDYMNPILDKITQMVWTPKQKYKKGVFKGVDLEQLKDEVQITDYAEIALGFKLNPKGNGLVSTYEHDSLMIYTQKNDFTRFSQTGVGGNKKVGGNIFNFVMHFENVDFPEAVEKVKTFHQEYGVKSPKLKKVATLETMKLPEAAKDNQKVINYLTKERKISLAIVKDLIDRGLLYQDVNDNCVFVGKLNENPMYANLRSSKKGGSFKMDVANSISDTGVYIDNESPLVWITEGVIDAMSLMSLQVDYDESDYLSVNGVAKAKNVFDFHMKNRVNEEKPLERVVIAFDNDRAGEEATIDLVKHIKENYPEIIIHHAYPKDVDWNDDLVNLSKKPEDLAPEAPFIYEGGLGY